MSTISGKILPQPGTIQEKDLYFTLDELITDLRKIINRGITFSDNVNCRLVTFTTSATPDAENTVAHTLGSIPTGYLVYSQDKAGSLYLGTTTWTTTNIYLKCSIASIAYKVIIF